MRKQSCSLTHLSAASALYSTVPHKLNSIFVYVLDNCAASLMNDLFYILFIFIVELYRWVQQSDILSLQFCFKHCYYFNAISWIKILSLSVSLSVCHLIYLDVSHMQSLKKHLTFFFNVENTSGYLSISLHFVFLFCVCLLVQSPQSIRTNVAQTWTYASGGFLLLKGSSSFHRHYVHVKNDWPLQSQ